MRMNVDPESLSTFVGKNEDSEIGNLLEQTSQESPYDLAEQNLLRQRLRGIIDGALNEREREMVRLRFGLKDGVSHTLQ